jgi:hypothetical protein
MEHPKTETRENIMEHSKTETRENIMEHPKTETREKYTHLHTYLLSIKIQ